MLKGEKLIGWNSQRFDPNLNDYQLFLNPNNVFEKILGTGPNFIFIYDFYRKGFHYINDNITSVLGLSPDKIKSSGLNHLIDMVHPDDIEILENAGLKAWEYIATLEKGKRDECKFSFDYRIKNTEGKYVRILQQNSILKVDNLGNIVYLLGVCSDISQWKNNNSYTLTLFGPGNSHKTIHLKNEYMKLANVAFSKRETQILKLLAEGNNSKAISDLLSISYHTVNTHRKNMLNKLNFKKSTELISYAMQNGMI